MKKSLKDLTEEDALMVARTIRPWIPAEDFYITINDKDRIVIRNDDYMVEEIWFRKTTIYGNSDTIAIYYERSSIDLDLVFLGYMKLIELGYELELLDIKKKRYKL